MSSPPPPQQPPRSFPAPCWNHEETVALIHAYRDKWFSLGRRTLRSPDWDDVASVVALHCPSSPSPKSSVQCRHKIEKLRRRYRAEKQRCASYSGRVFSSWDLFHLIDSIEAGSEPEILVPKTRGKKNLRDGDDDFDPSYDFGSSFGGGAKTPADRNEVVLGLSATNPPKIDRNFVSNFNVGQNRGGRIHRAVSDYDYGGGRDYASPIPLGVRLRHRTADSLDPDYHGSRYPSKAIGGGNMGSLGLRPKKHRRTDEMLDSDDDDSVESDEEMAFRPSSSFRPENGRAQAPVGRKINPFTEIASSIKMLGDEFVRMEKMKMEMAREFEKTRMRFEMKRNEMIIKSEQMIISAVIEAVHENKKVGKAVSPET
ncbi:protein FIP2-like [Punica granatum]|uniref:Protein FIP2-like n=1 Tax=Punica granatum TaxID=22663 RepID=A0A218XNY6_PUNGR|nr:protein FIP2-like [Punica granatum]OWM86376.1 hypothetical protein CDL15_Pgr021462 [Punica granatum]